MSIQSQINRINSNVAAAYAAAQEKGASMPSQQNSANLVSAISSINAVDTVTFSAQYSYDTHLFSGLPSDVYTQVKTAHEAGKNVLIIVNAGKGVHFMPLTGTNPTSGYFTFSAPVGYIEMMSDGFHVETASIAIAICSIYSTGNHYYEYPIYDL